MPNTNTKKTGSKVVGMTVFAAVAAGLAVAVGSFFKKKENQVKVKSTLKKAKVQASAYVAKIEKKTLAKKAQLQKKVKPVAKKVVKKIKKAAKKK